MGNMGGSSSSSSEVGSKRSKAVEVTYDNSIYEYYYHLDAYSSEENANTVWYKFKPKADGTFRIYLEEIERDYTITVYKNKKQIAVGDLNSDINIELEKGKKYYITVTQSLNYDGDYNYDKYSNYDYSYRFTVGAPIPMGADKDHAYELQLGENASQTYDSLLPPPDYSGEKNKGDNVIGEMSGGSGEVWFKYTAITGGEHTFTLTDFDGYANFYFYRSAEGGYESIYDTNSAKYNLVQGNTYYIRLEVRSNYSSLDTNFGVLVEDEPEGMSKNSAIDIQVGANTEQAFEALEGDGSEVWLKLEPGTPGYYSFAFENDKNAFTPDISVYKVEWILNDWETKETIYKNNGYYNFSDEKGIYLIKVNTSSYDSFAVNVAKLADGAIRDAAIEIELGETEAEEWDALDLGDSVWFKFTPSETNYYQIHVNGDSSASIAVYEGSSTYTSTLYSQGYYMYYYYTYYIKVSPSVTSFGLDISRMKTGADSSDAIKLYDGTTMSAGYNSSYNSNGEVWFEFTPSESGHYRFYVSDASRRYFYVKDSVFANVYEMPTYTTSSYNEAVVNLTAGETYYAVVDFYSSSYYDSSFYMLVQKSPRGASATDAITITSSSQNVGYNSSYNTDGEMWFKFDVPSYGDYIVYLSSLSSNPHTRIYIYSDPNESNLVGSSDGYFSYQSVNAYGLSAGTYYVKVEWAYSASSNPSATYADTSFYINAYLR